LGGEKLVKERKKNVGKEKHEKEKRVEKEKLENHDIKLYKNNIYII